MKLSKQNLESLIQEEAESLSEIDIRGWLQRLKAIKASDFLKDLKKSEPEDFQGVQKGELQRIAGIYKLLVQYAKDDNVQSGEVDKALDMLEAALNKAGTIDKVLGTSPDEPTEQTVDTLPEEDQVDIVTTLINLKTGKLTPGQARNELVRDLTRAKVINFQNENLESRKFVYTIVNFLNENNVIELEESISSLVKREMKNEILTEINNLKVEGLLLEQASSDVQKQIGQLIGMLGNAKKEKIAGIANSIYKYLMDSGYLSPEVTPEKVFYMKRDDKKDVPQKNTTQYNPSQSPLSGPTPPFPSETIFRHLYNLSEQGVIQIDDNQKRIVKTMMIAETQLQIDKQLRNMLRR